MKRLSPTKSAMASASSSSSSSSSKRGPPRSPSKHRLDGLFREGIWYCNCEPRLPALSLQVRRETANKGRSFYTCQKDKAKQNQCRFFLWAEDARAREMGAVLSNSRSEAQPSAAAAAAAASQHQPPQTPSRKQKKQTTLHASITPRAGPSRTAGDDRTPVTRLADMPFDASSGVSSNSATQSTATLRGSGPSSSAQAPPSLGEAPAASGAKRKRVDDAQQDDFGDFSSGEEEELVAITDNSASKTKPPPSSSVAPKQPATPATSSGRAVDLAHGMATPVTGKPVRRVLFAEPQRSGPETGGGDGKDMGATATPAAKRQRTDERGLFSTALSTPGGGAGARAQSPASSTPSSSQQDGSTSITTEVMDILKDQRLPEALTQSVRAALDRHAAKAKGLERGRDASRQAVRAAEVRIAELQQRVTDLENNRRAEAEARKRLRSGLMGLYEES